MLAPCSFRPFLLLLNDPCLLQCIFFFHIDWPLSRPDLNGILYLHLNYIVITPRQWTLVDNRSWISNSTLFFKIMTDLSTPNCLR